MGGGVSLGTFCGASLAQALKLLIVYGRDREGRPYDDIVVDVFSGASAGALSLAAMLRGLLARTTEQERKAEQTLDTEFGADLAALGKKQKAQLLAAQVVWDLQKQLWSEEIKLSKLLAATPGNLRFKASILNRGAVDDIARRHLVDWNGTGIRFDQRQLLADRVLYACTLANLTPLIADARLEFPGNEVGFVGLNDGMRSHVHRDLRVFDLNFTAISSPENKRYPDRWCLYHASDPEPTMVDDLRLPKTWAQIAATAVASGGFPIAFEPVVLRRKAFEYGPRIWCPTLGRANFDGQEPHLFSYVDGGTFNNEPIREAFRLASFIDGTLRAEQPDVEIERLILFVDPFVSERLINARVPFLRRWMMEDPNVFGNLDGFDLRRAASLDRLLPHIGTLLGSLTAQGRTNEANKIFQVRNRFTLRDGIRASLDATLGTGTTAPEFKKLIEFCRDQIKRNDSDDAIPPGPGSLESELERVIHEQIETHRQSGEGNDYLPLRGGAGAFLASAEPHKMPGAELWLRLLNFVAVDLILGLEGKVTHSQLVAIAPFKDLRIVQQPDGSLLAEAAKIDLPGGRLSGFAGFMSDIPDQLDYRAANHCAEEFLVKCGRIVKTTPPPEISGLELSAEEQKVFEQDIKKGLDDLSQRCAAMVKHSHLIQIFPLLDSAVSQLIAAFVRNAVKGIDLSGARTLSVELRVIVPNERFELDGAGVGDQDCAPVEDTPGSKPTLITIADYNFDRKQWTGGFVKNGRLDIDEDGTAFLGDKDFCEIELPTEAQLGPTQFSPNATFLLTLKKEDRNTTISASRWTLGPGANPLEEELLP